MITTRRPAQAGILILLVAIVGVAGCVSPGSDGASAPPAQGTGGPTLPTATSGASGPALTGSVSFSGPDVTLLTPSGLRLSQDGGRSWSDISLPSGLSAPSVMAVSTAQNEQVFLAAEEPSGNVITLYDRPSSGGAWTQSLLTPSWPAEAGITGSAQTVAITSGPGGVVAVSASVVVGTALAYNSVFVSQDDGKTFVQHPAGYPSDANIVWDSMLFSTSQTGVVVVGPTLEGLIHTSDGGAHWAKPSLPTMPAPGSFELGQPVLVGPNIQVPMASQATTGNATFAFLISKDGGMTFTSGPSLSLPDGESVSTSLGLRTWVVSSTGAAIYETSDNGQTWATVSATGLPQNVASLTLTGTNTATAQVVTRGCQGFKTGCWTQMYLVATSDGGHTWTPL